MRGGRPKPTALKLVTGNRGKRRLPKHEPKPKRIIPAAPVHLSDRAKVAWGSLSARLDQFGVLTAWDAEALEQLCENYAEILELREDIRENGRFQEVRTKSGDVMERCRPAATLLADAERRFRGMMVEFGLTPSARARVHGNQSDDNSDPAEAYFG